MIPVPPHFAGYRAFLLSEEIVLLVTPDVRSYVVRNLNTPTSIEVDMDWLWQRLTDEEKHMLIGGSIMPLPLPLFSGDSKYTPMPNLEIWHDGEIWIKAGAQRLEPLIKEWREKQ